MTYEARSLRRQKVRYNSDITDSPLKYQLVVAGAKVTPTGVVVDVYSPDGTQLLTSESMTLVGSIATYSIDTTTTATWLVGTGYRAHVSSTVTVGESSTFYEDDIIFDVVKYLLVLDIGRDQLVALDDRIRGMDHDGDEDFSEVIEAIRDELQIMIECRTIDTGSMLENMLLDKSKVSIPARYRVLAQIFESKQNYEAADRYNKLFDALWREMLAGTKLDTSGDLQESARPQGIHGVRLRF